MSESNNNPQEWHPDSDTQIISDQTIISPISLRLCCIKIVDFMSKSQTRRSRGEFICSQLDELLAKSVGVITPSVKTLFGLENKAFKNTQNKLKLAVIIANEVRLHLDEKTAGEAKKIALTSVEKWLNSITPQPQGNQPPASQEPATGRELPSELDTEQARKYFARAVAAGLMSEQYKWLASQSLLACFCREMSVNLDLGKGYSSEGQKRLSWKPFEALFNVKAKNLTTSLNDIKKTGQDPIGIEKVEAIFKD